MDRVRCTVIGAGVIGLSVARLLSERGEEVLVLEECPDIGTQTSSRNSEVIHAGLYYPACSLKSRLCIRGRNLLYDYCESKGIPFRKTGKILAAYDNDSETVLMKVFDNARSCGLRNTVLLSSREVKSMVPGVTATMGLYSPDTGILDTHIFLKRLYSDALRRGTTFSFNTELTGLNRGKDGWIVTAKDSAGDGYSYLSSVVVNASGLSSDRVASMAGIDIDKAGYRLWFSKGTYFRLRRPEFYGIDIPVYPPPLSDHLGIHLTPDMAGGIRLGPDAERVYEADYSVDERKIREFSEALNRFIRIEESDIIPDTAGIRPKLGTPGDGFRDFVISSEKQRGLPGLINLIGIDSPGLTSSLAIAETVADMLGSA